MPLRLGQFQKRHVLFDGSSAQSTTYTSGSVYVGDYAELSIQVDAIPASNISLQGSNDDGLRASINTWSAVSRIVTAGLYDVTTGYRWARAIRDSVNSLCVITLQGKSVG